MKDFCVVCQGPTVCENVKNIKKYWDGFSIIFSTWENSNKECYTSDDIVLYNEIPSNVGVKNLNLQKISSLNGFLLAKEMGFKKVVKWRQDLYPTNAKKLTKLFKKNYINFYTYYNHEHGYVCDYFISGDVDDMISLFSNLELNVPYPEYSITESLKKTNLIKSVNFIYENITKECDIFWESKNLYLSQTQNKLLMKNNINFI